MDHDNFPRRSSEIRTVRIPPLNIGDILQRILRHFDFTLDTFFVFNRKYDISHSIVTRYIPMYLNFSSDVFIRCNFNNATVFQFGR